MDSGLPDGMFMLMTPDELPKTMEGFGPFFQQKEKVGHGRIGVATTDYFKVLEIPLIRGRLFSESDGPDSPHVAVISESLARERWRGRTRSGTPLSSETWTTTCAC